MKQALLVRDLASISILFVVLHFIHNTNPTFCYAIISLIVIRLIATVTYNITGFNREKEAMEEFNRILAAKPIKEE